MTRDEFLDDPNHHYFLSGCDIPDEWFVEAWETVPEFRENHISMIEHDVSKGLGLEAAQIESLRGLLPLSRMVELFAVLRNSVPWMEPDFRPAFEEVLGERMAAFPPALTPSEREALFPEPPEESGDEIPY